MQGNKLGNKQGNKEFIALLACLSTLSLFALDAMLAALPEIGRSMNIQDENQRQLIVTTFWLGLAGGQIFYGPLADRFGRRPVLLGCLLAYALFGTLSALAADFDFLLLMRFLQGLAAAGAAVLAPAIVRDRYVGDAQARAQSQLSFLILFVPTLAPLLGQAWLEVGDWRQLLTIIAFMGLLLMIWSFLRLNETLAAENRRSLTLTRIWAALAQIGRTRAVIGNIAVAAFAFAAFSAFIHSIQQIVADAFHRPDDLWLAFMWVAAPVAIAYRINAALVSRIGARRLLLLALIATLICALVHLAVVLALGETFFVFLFLQGLTMVWIGFTNANCIALAMAPMGEMAATASAVRGTLVIGSGAVAGRFVGDHFDGTALPLTLGFAVCASLALIAGLWANPKPERKG